MKIVGLWALLLVVSYALQTSLLSFINFDGFSANLLLLMTVSVSYLRGFKQGVFFGFIAGLLQDATSGSYFGLAILSYMTVALAFGKFSVNMFRDEALLPVITAIPALALHFAITIALLFLLGWQIDFVRLLKFDFWPAAITQVVLSWPVHRLICQLDEFSRL